MAVDVAGDVAVTAFARRGVGCTWQDFHVLARRGDRWVLLGGGGGTSEPDLLDERPAVLPAALLLAADGSRTGTRAMAVGGAGGVRDDRGRVGRWPWSGRWVSYGEVRVSVSVASLRVDGAYPRAIPVPWHGRAVVVWTGRRPPRLTALDAGGSVIGTAVLPGRRLGAPCPPTGPASG